ncbi:MAG TPA: UDP-glucose 4-epimerase GalE [Chryseosolibacter sp.]
MNAKKILVTGGAGYIGAHTAYELFKAGYEPILIDDFSKSDRTLLDGLETLSGRKFSFYQGNCSDKLFLRTLFEEAGPFSCVMHFAAYKSVGESVSNPLMYYENNISSLLSLLQVMAEHKLFNLIFSSSCTVYGQPDIIPVREDAPFKRAESPYGATKQICERILEDVYATGFRIISLRYFNPIGAHPSGAIGELPVGAPNNLVPYITQTAAGVRKKLTVFGNDYNTPDGSCIRDFIHVVDLGHAHVKAMEYLVTNPHKSLLEAFNLGTGVGVSVLELVTEFSHATGIKFPFEIGPRRPGDVEKVFGDPTKANNLLNWRTTYSLRDSLLHAWNWEKKIRNVQ